MYPYVFLRDANRTVHADDLPDTPEEAADRYREHRDYHNDIIAWIAGLEWAEIPATIRWYLVKYYEQTADFADVVNEYADGWRQ
jgi:hypothetical protein